jgi:hypothetical protein
LDEETAENVGKCEDYFAEEGIKYALVEEDAKIFSVGYSRQTIAHARDNETHLISIMAQVAGDTKVFGNVEKENIILNDPGSSGALLPLRKTKKPAHLSVNGLLHFDLWSWRGSNPRPNK